MGQDVLRGISFEAPAGTMTALVGPSGAGKTTTTALLTRLYDVTSGTIRVGGTDVRDATLASLRQAVGVVTQDSHLFHDTIRANLLYARPDATEAELVEACESTQVGGSSLPCPRASTRLSVTGAIGSPGGRSDGVALARLLLKGPRVVVLDEATAHLDSESEAAVSRALDHALEGRTSVVIAHRLSTVRRADQILVITRARWSSGARTTTCWPAEASTPTSTGRSSPRTVRSRLARDAAVDGDQRAGDVGRGRAQDEGGDPAETPRAPHTGPEGCGRWPGRAPLPRRRSQHPGQRGGRWRCAPAAAR